MILQALVPGRVRDPRGGKTRAPQTAGIAAAARPALGIRLVAGHRLPVIDAEPRGRTLAHVLEPKLYPRMEAIANVYQEAIRQDKDAKKINPIELWEPQGRDAP